MNLEEYRSNQNKEYERLAKTVKNILQKTIWAFNKKYQAYPEYRIRLQHIQYRAKAPKSLEQKLKSEKLLQNKKIEQSIKDLAGCRLIFYLNSDIDKFINSGILLNHFDIVFDKVRFHYPQQDAENTSMFISDNYVVTLKNAFTDKAVYQKFKGKYCEIQIQTILQHAWSEIAHDMIYKSKMSSSHLGYHFIPGIEKRLNGIMIEHLNPAGYDLRTVSDDFEKLLKGQQIFNENSFEQRIREHTRNNRDLYTKLVQFKEEVLPLYDSKQLQATHTNIRKTVFLACQMALDNAMRAKNNKFDQSDSITVDPISGKVSGEGLRRFDPITLDAVWTISLDILDGIRYINEDAVSDTLDTLCKLYPIATETQHKRLLDSANRLAEYSASIYDKFGLFIQQRLIETVNTFSAPVARSSLPIILQILEKIFELEVHDHSGIEFNKQLNKQVVVISCKALMANTNLVTLRKLAINTLKKIFEMVKTPTEKQQVIGTLWHATSQRAVMIKEISDEMQYIILKDSVKVLTFYKKICRQLPHLFLESLERWCLIRYHHNQFPSSVSKIRQAQLALNEALINFRDYLNQDQHFVFFKTLIGWEGVLEQEWKNEVLSIDAIKQYREETLTNWATQINPHNANRWFDIINDCANTQSNDRMAFMSYFRNFLEKLVQHQPKIVLNYLDKLDNEKPLIQFLPTLLCALDSTAYHQIVLKKVRYWVNEQKYIIQIARYCEWTQSLDMDLLKNLLNTVSGSTDENIWLYIMKIAIKHFSPTSRYMIDRVFMPAFQVFKTNRNVDWIQAIFPFIHQSTIFQSLTDTQKDDVLTSLIHHPVQNFYCVEELLYAIGQTAPAKVVDFFYQRLKTDDYNWIPSKLTHCGPIFEQNITLLIKKMFGWFCRDASRFNEHTVDARRLIRCIFPTPTLTITNALHQFIEKNSQTDQNQKLVFIIKLLQIYKCHPDTHELYKYIVKILPNKSHLSAELVDTFSWYFGSWEGDDGRLRIYRQRQKDMYTWQKDANKKIKAFAKRVLEKLERLTIPHENRTVDKITEKEKH